MDASGNVYVADTGNNRIQKFTSSGTFLSKWGTLGPKNGQFSAPAGVAVDASGNPYVADTDNSRVQVFGYPGVSVLTEGPHSFALDPIRPNPSRGGALTVHSSLPTTEPARLELIDVAGRRFASRDVGIGQTTFDLGKGLDLAPGLYLVRLRQGPYVRVTRVAALR